MSLPLNELAFPTGTNVDVDDNASAPGSDELATVPDALATVPNAPALSSTSTLVPVEKSNKRKREGYNYDADVPLTPCEERVQFVL
jgi:hypothetical protein